VRLAGGASVHVTDERGQSLVHWAVFGGSNEVVVALVAAGALVGAVARDGQTPLHWAARGGDAKTLAVLVDAGADVKASANDGQTPLHWAARRGDMGVVAALLRANAPVGAKAVDGQTPLHWAARSGSKGAVTVLLEAGALAWMPDQHGLTPLHWAAQGNDEEVWAALLSAEAKVASVATDGQTPLHWAACVSKMAVAAMLTRSSVLSKANDSQMPLHWAAHAGDKGAVAALIVAGAPVYAVDGRGQTPLHWAARGGKAEAVVELLHAGAAVEAKDNRDRQPIHWAARSGVRAVVAALLDAGTPVESTDGRGRTPLHWAARAARQETVEALLDAGALVQMADHSGETALHAAARSGSKGVVAALIAAGAVVDAVDQLSQTPLHLAARAGEAPAVAVLVAAGAQVRAADERGQTPLKWAARSGGMEVFAALGAAESAIEEPASDGLMPLREAAPDAAAGKPSLLAFRKRKGVAADEDVMVMMAATESQFSKMKIYALLSNSDRDAVLRSFCVTSSERGWSRLCPGEKRPPTLPPLPTVALPHMSLVSPDAVAVLGAEVHHAFGASVTAHAGFDVSPRWLQQWFGEESVYEAVACVNGGGGVSTTVLRHGQSLYVATARAMSWRAWVGFCSTRLVAVDAVDWSLSAHPPDAALPGRVAVQHDVWTAFCAQRSVLAAVRDAADRCRLRDNPVTGVVFCGHGFGAAVAQLLAVAWTPPNGGLEPLPSTLVTFGCPAVGNAAFQARVLDQTWHQRLYVKNDPIAGLPHSPCDGLRLAPAAKLYAEPQACEHWALSADGQAQESSADAPQVHSLSVAGITFAGCHSLAAYAECLSVHYKAVRRGGVRPVESAPAAATRAGMRRWHRISSRLLGDPASSRVCTRGPPSRLRRVCAAMHRSPLVMVRLRSAS